MILEGNARAHGLELARHLLNARDNDHVTLHALDGFMADDLPGALEEAEAISQATQCRKYLFSLSLNPPMEASVSVAGFEAVLAKAERDLGLAGQPKAVVFHEKNGRRHAHVVWSRIDTDRMKAIQLPHFKRKLMAISRAQYLEHGWDMPAGFQDAEMCDPDRFTNAEAGQAKRAERPLAGLKAMFRGCWESSDSQNGFAAALAAKGFALARGDRRSIVAVDATGSVWSLSRWCGVKARDLKRKVSQPDRLPNVAQATLLAQGFETYETPKKSVADKDRERRLAEMVKRQRQERATLLAALKKREADRLKETPKGMHAAFLKMTGRYQAFLDRCAKETVRAKAADQAARQSLIDRHLAERQAFDREHARHHGPVPPRQTDNRQRLELRREPSELSAERLQGDPSLILAELSKTKAAFTRTDTMHALSRFFDDHSVLRKTADAALTSTQAVKLASDRTAFYTTRDYQRAEARLHRSASQLKAASTPPPSSNHLRAAFNAKNAKMKREFGGSLSVEQTQAIKHVLGNERLATVVGLAGAGKSTMLATAADAWRRQGIAVHGAALAGKAADGLQEASGIPSRTLASLELSWKNGNKPIKQGDVLIIDEAGMIGTRQMSRVCNKIDEIGAKLVLVGDPDQLQPIEAGTPFRDLVDQHGAAKLTEVRRQRSDWQKGATQRLAQGDTSKAVQAYRNAGGVAESAKQADAVEALAERYASDVLSEGNASGRLALAHKRIDVHALNQSIRAALRDPANQDNDVLLQTATGKRAFGAEDRIVFSKNDKDLGVKNGMLGTVQKVADGEVVVSLDGDAKQKITFDPRHYQSFDHGYAVTIHKSQGVTVDQAYVLGSRSMDKHLAYVALTRHREDVQLFTSREDRPTWTQGRQHVQKRDQARDGPSLG